MLTKQEKEFMVYWEENRARERSLTHILLYGLPRGLCFGIPILLCFLFHDWYKWLPFISGEDILVVAIGVFGVVLFYSVFRQYYLWDRKEQQYQEFSARQAQQDAPPPPVTPPGSAG